MLTILSSHEASRIGVHDIWQLVNCPRKFSDSFLESGAFRQSMGNPIASRPDKRSSASGISVVYAWYRDRRRSSLPGFNQYDDDRSKATKPL